MRKQDTHSIVAAWSTMARIHLNDIIVACDILPVFFGDHPAHSRLKGHELRTESCPTPEVSALPKEPIVICVRNCECKQGLCARGQTSVFNIVQ
jgi:hypothetical protein